ncbi:hypothetical protein DPMN_132397 [Dreissena polymorpha]|uniref:Uncharacterized protein n=1 Tax=Dreissena polymorpha TaxID=45954 RepID=A0A9D4FSE8_DREPO|nr:hypothetical protein DPMN_132397 [Dreissena polymorpha]
MRKQTNTDFMVALENQYESRAFRPRLLHARLHSTTRKFKEIHGKLFDTWGIYEDDEITTTQLRRRCIHIAGLEPD